LFSAAICRARTASSFCRRFVSICLDFSLSSCLVFGFPNCACEAWELVFWAFLSYYYSRMCFGVLGIRVWKQRKSRNCVYVCMYVRRGRWEETCECVRKKKLQEGGWD
jgi:hypothetical protein